MSDTAPGDVELGIDGVGPAREIGRGGFGVVYRARQPALDRTVAVKVVGTSLDGVDRERFEREARAAGALSSHPNIVAVHGAGLSSAGRPYLLMDFARRGSLGARLEREGPVPWEEAIEIAVKLAGALETAHRAGTLHRDVKPENVLVSDYGEPLLTDFGIARIAGGFETRSGPLTGSLLFTAPEILDGGPATVAADVYALAATSFALLSGRAPFGRHPDEALVALFVRVARDVPPDLRGRGVPDPVASVIETGLAKDPADRPASAAQLGERLRDAQRALGVPPTSIVLSSPPPPRAQGPAELAPAAAPDREHTTQQVPRTAAPPVEAGEGYQTRPAPSGPSAGQPRQPRTPRRRGRLVATAAVTAVTAVAAVAAFIVARGPDDFPGGSTGTSVGASAGISPETSAAPSAGPAAASSTSVSPAPSPGRSVGLQRPTSVAVASDGTLYVTDPDRHRVVRVGPDGTAEDVGRGAGNLSFPGAVVVAPGGTVFVADSGNGRLLKLDAAGAATPVPLVASADAGFLGFEALAAARDGTIYAATKAAVFSIGEGGRVSGFAGTGKLGFTGDGGKASAAQVDGVKALAIGADGDLYLAQANDNRIRRVDTATGIITTIAGTGETRTAPDGTEAATGPLGAPEGLAVGGDGSIVLSEFTGNAVRRIGVDGKLATVAGQVAPGSGVDGGPSRDAQLNGPRGVAIGPDGSIYVADAGNGRVRRIGTDGVITTVA